MPTNPPKKPRRPVLTRAVVDGLRQVSRECELNVDERLGCERPIGNEEACQRAMTFLDALVEWYEATHPPEPQAEPTRQQRAAAVVPAPLTLGDRGDTLETRRNALDRAQALLAKTRLLNEAGLHATIMPGTRKGRFSIVISL